MRKRICNNLTIYTIKQAQTIQADSFFLFTLSGAALLEVRRHKQAWHCEWVLFEGDVLGLDKSNEHFSIEKEMRISPLGNFKFGLIEKKKFFSLTANRTDVHEYLEERYATQRAFIMDKLYLFNYPNDIQVAYLLLALVDILKLNKEGIIIFPIQLSQRKIASLAKSSVSRTNQAFHQLRKLGFLVSLKPIIIQEYAALANFLERNIH